MTEAGICTLSLVPVRTQPGDRHELCTQLLFGDTYTPLESTADGAWLRIRIDFDDYEGWIDHKQHQPLAAAVRAAWRTEAPHYVAEQGAVAKGSDGDVPLLPGSCLPAYDGGVCQWGQLRYTIVGAAIKPQNPQPFPVLADLARRFYGAPYLWGGKTLFGVDCSGLVQQVFKMGGYALPRDAWQQAEAPAGQLVETVSDAAPGDLAFFANSQGRIVHVGILLENQQILHAHGRVRTDLLDDTGIYQVAADRYSHALAFLKRFVGS